MNLPAWEDLRAPAAAGLVLLVALGAVSWLASPAPPGELEATAETSRTPSLPATPPVVASRQPQPESPRTSQPAPTAAKPTPAAAPATRPATPMKSTQSEPSPRAAPPAVAHAAPTPAPSVQPPAPRATPTTPPAPHRQAASATGVRIHLDAEAADAVLRGGGSLVAMRSDGLWVAAWPDGGVQRVSDVDRWVHASHAKVVQDDLIACADPDGERRRWLRRKLGDGVVGHIVIPAHLYDSWTSRRARSPELFVRFSPSTGFVVEDA